MSECLKCDNQGSFQVSYVGTSINAWKGNLGNIVKCSPTNNQMKQLKLFTCTKAPSDLIP